MELWGLKDKEKTTKRKKAKNLENKENDEIEARQVNSVSQQMSQNSPNTFENFAKNFKSRLARWRSELKLANLIGEPLSYCENCVRVLLKMEANLASEGRNIDSRILMPFGYFSNHSNPILCRYTVYPRTYINILYPWVTLIELILLINSQSWSN